ncbi:MAG: carboxypeptidase-like regulatory domain-containing protein [Candidatus Aminicenantes bacterium]
MIQKPFFRSKVLAGGLIAAFMLLVTPLPNLAQTPDLSKAGTLSGTVYTEGMKSQVAGAVVKIRNLNTQKEFVSLPTDAKGNFRIMGIEEGWYTVGVSASVGDFNLNYGIYVKAGSAAKLSLEMLPGGMLEGKGAGGTAGKSFFKKPIGILAVIVVAAGVGFGIYQLTKSEGDVSPIR